MSGAVRGRELITPSYSIEKTWKQVYYKLYGKDNFCFLFEGTTMVKNNIELGVKIKYISRERSR